MNIRFACPECEQPRRIDLPGVSESHCPSCDQMLKVPAESGKEPLRKCVVCGNAEMYRKKDFPQWLGMLILAVACLSFLGLMAVYHPWWAWTILIGSAIFDGLLYLWVGDVVVCYRCAAQHRGLASPSEHASFELGIGERYRQERIRLEQMKQSKQ